MEKTVKGHYVNSSMKQDGKEGTMSSGLWLLPSGQRAPSPLKKIRNSIQGFRPIRHYKLGRSVEFFSMSVLFCKIGGSGGSAS